MSIQLDHTDRKILRILQEDSNITNVELSERLDLAPATTLKRVKKLEEAGVIRRYVALVDAGKVDMGLLAFVEVQLAEHASRGVDGFQAAVTQLDQVLECYHLTGENDYLLKVAVPSIDSYERFLLEKLTQVPNVGRVHTSFVLSTVKHDTRLPIR